MAVERAHGVVNAKDLKVFFGVPLNAVTSQHVHRIIQVKYFCIYFVPLFFFFFFTDGLSFLHQVLGESLHLASECLTQEAKVASLASKMEVLEKENSTLKKKLIDSMDEATTLKENVKALNADLRVEHQLNLEKDDQLQAAKEKLKTIAARSVEAFQQTEEYATMLFSWYFKGFELLRRYLVKHPIGVDLPNLDLEVVDQEMAMDEAA